jgi:L-malate glycosyltransferase
MNSTFRIALVAASPAIIGGHSVQAVGLMNQLSADGHDVTYIPIDARFPFGLRWVRRVRFARTLLNGLLYVLSLRHIVRADVVHVFSASYWSFVLGPAPAIVAAKLLRKPVILHYHSGEADDHLRRWRRVVTPFLKLVNEIVVPSLYLERIFAAHGFRARVIPNGIDISRFRFRERTFAAPRLLSARNLERHYGVDVIIDAFAQVKRRFPQATLVVAGSGSEERALRAQAQHVDGIRFLGAVDPAAMPATYDGADVFVNASVIDNQPVSILEAFAAGLPVVTTATGDIGAMLLHGDAGVLVDRADAATIADAIARLLEQPAVAIAAARHAREEAERYSWPRVAMHWKTLYSELLGTAAGEVLAHGA